MLEIVPLFVKALLVLPIPPFVLSKGAIDGPLLILFENPFPNMVPVVAWSFLRESCNLAKEYTTCKVLGLNILTFISNSYFNPTKKQLNDCLRSIKLCLTKDQKPSNTLVNLLSASVFVSLPLDHHMIVPKPGPNSFFILPPF